MVIIFVLQLQWKGGYNSYKIFHVARFDGVLSVPKSVMIQEEDVMRS